MTPCFGFFCDRHKFSLSFPFTLHSSSDLGLLVLENSGIRKLRSTCPIFVFTDAKHSQFSLFKKNNILLPALGLPGWLGLDKSAAIAIAVGILILSVASCTAYKLYYCKTNRELRTDEIRTATTGQYHGKIIFS